MENQLFCLDSTPKFLNLFDFSVAPPLLFYAYVPILIIVLFLGFFILTKDKFSLKSKAFLAISLSFSLWIINMIIQWVGVNINLVYFAWKITAVIEIMIPISTVYFIYILLNNKNITSQLKFIFISIILPVVILWLTKLNMTGFNTENCSGIVGPLLYYVYFIEIISSLWIVILGLEKLNLAKKENNMTEYIRIKRLFYLITGSAIFILIFALSNIFGEITKVYEINLFGPIGMVIFLSLLSFMIVKYKTFNIKVLAVQALVVGLIFLIGSQFFFINSTINFILNGVTFFSAIIFGYMLIKSVSEEVKQRERMEVLSVELEKSNSDLEVANEKLKGLDQLKNEFVSLASHQLRSPLTAIRGYTSMIIDGDYGQINNKEASDAIAKIFESSKNLNKIVEDLLNVTKIEQGGMKYEMTPFDLSSLTKEVVEYLSINAEKRNIKLTYEPGNECFTNGDKEKLRQVIINFIDNSIKYTKEGEIHVSVLKEKDKVIFKVKDTGVGMTKEIKETLFHKFARGEGARMNTTGTGLGLYLAKEIAEAHKGTVSVDSEGPGKGSTFIMELNALQ